MKTRFVLSRPSSLPGMNLPPVTRPAHILIPFHTLIFVGFLLVMAGCAPQPESDSLPIQKAGPTLTSTPLRLPVSPTFTFTPRSAASTPFICNENWQSLPIIPNVTDAARLLYQQGLTHGNNSHAFSKIGDGEISTTWFLTTFDLGSDHDNFGNYQSLSTVIENFPGSFERTSLAARRGFNTKLILDSSVSDPALCNAGESPLKCELRIHNPSIAILSLGTNQAYHPEEFEAGMRQIINELVSKHVLPILSTKGDNLEGDHSLNRRVACLAQEYQIPLWNFWAAIQPLPNHGLQPDLEHLTYFGTNDFDDPVAMQSAWTVRNLTALQVLDAVWQGVK
jgi:hypothetical protein